MRSRPGNCRPFPDIRFERVEHRVRVALPPRYVRSSGSRVGRSGTFCCRSRSAGVTSRAQLPPHLVCAQLSGRSRLGLPIARWIAEAHRGTLAVERSGGTTFRVSLPLYGVTHLTKLPPNASVEIMARDAEWLGAGPDDLFAADGPFVADPDRFA